MPCRRVTLANKGRKVKIPVKVRLISPSWRTGFYGAADKCLTCGTLEEKIDALILQKRELADELVGTTSEVDISGMSNEEIFNFVSLDSRQIMG